LFDFLDEPSAMFDGIETQALRNWLTKPNFLPSGNIVVVA
jgi:hypothetical protein